MSDDDDFPDEDLADVCSDCGMIPCECNEYDPDEICQECGESYDDCECEE